MEFLRQNSQIRYRSNSGMLVMKIRNQCINSIHNYLHQLGFYNVQCPVLTSNDCEGAGEAFKLSPIILEQDHPYFPQDVFLTVSGQLEAELFAQSLKYVYSFGPTFRAENSHTKRVFLYYFIAFK